MPCQAMGAVRGARGDRKSGANGCEGVSWSEELDVKELRGALGSEHEPEPRGCPFFWTPSTHPSSPTAVWYADFKVLPLYCCNAVQ